MKAAFVLLPLLGANNVLAIVGPISMLPVVYGIWSFASFALTGFQGLLFSLLYCFSSNDVRFFYLLADEIAREVHKNKREKNVT